MPLSSMKKSLLSAILFLLAFGAQAQTADAIIAKYLEAMGGEAWETIKTMRMEATVTTQATLG